MKGSDIRVGSFQVGQGSGKTRLSCIQVSSLCVCVHVSKTQIYIKTEPSSKVSVESLTTPNQKSNKSCDVLFSCIQVYCSQKHARAHACVLCANTKKRRMYHLGEGGAKRSDVFSYFIKDLLGNEERRPFSSICRARV